MGEHTFIIETSAVADTDALEELVELLENHDDILDVQRAVDFHDTLDRQLLGHDGPP